MSAEISERAFEEAGYRIERSCLTTACGDGRSAPPRSVYGTHAMIIEVSAVDHIYVTVSDLERSIAFYDPVMKLIQLVFRPRKKEELEEKKPAG